MMFPAQMIWVAEAYGAYSLELATEGSWHSVPILVVERPPPTGES